MFTNNLFLTGCFSRVEQYTAQTHDARQLYSLQTYPSPLALRFCVRIVKNKNWEKKRRSTSDVE